MDRNKYLLDFFEKKKKVFFFTKGGHDHFGHLRPVKEVVSKTFIGYTYRIKND